MSEEKNKWAKLEITRYDFQYVEGKPKIVVHQIKVSDKDDNYIKFASMREALPFLSKLPVKFRDKE